MLNFVDIIVSHLHPTLGLENAVLQLKRLLDSRGCSVRIIVLGGDQNDLKAADNVVICGAPQRGLRRASIRRASKAIGALRPGATVILAGAWAALPVLLVASRSPQRIVIWEHSFVVEKRRSSRSLRWLAVAARFLYRRADEIVCVSRPLADDMDVLVRGPRIRVIPNVLPARSRAVPARAAGSLRLLAVGTLSATKNHSLLIDLLASTGQADTRLTVLGQGPEMGRLVDRAERLGVADRIEFRGHVSQAEVEVAMNECDIVVHPAHGETFGYVYFEGATAHRPVIASANRIAEELIPKFVPGVVVEAVPAAFSDAITEVVNNKFTALDFATADEMRDLHFGESQVAAAWLEVIEDS